MLLRIGGLSSRSRGSKHASVLFSLFLAGTPAQVVDITKHMKRAVSPGWKPEESWPKTVKALYGVQLSTEQKRRDTDRNR